MQKKHWLLPRLQKWTAKYTKVITKFDEFFKVRKNIIFECAWFNLRCQGEGESIEHFIISLYSLAELCALKDELIRDRIVVGIRDKALSKQMQVDPNLTLDKAKWELRQREAVQEQQRVLKCDQGKIVDSVWRPNTPPGSPRQRPVRSYPLAVLNLGQAFQADVKGVRKAHIQAILFVCSS